MTYQRKEVIGHCTLYLGDCLDILPTLGKVDAVVTDPPYEILNKFGTSLTGKSKGKRVMEFAFDYGGVFDGVVIPAIALALEKATGKCGHFVFAAPDHISKLHALFRSEGYTPKPAVWVKKYPPPPMPGNWWVSAHELALYAYKTGAFFGDKRAQRPNVFTYDSYRFGMPGKEDHPTQKPLALIEEICNALVPSNVNCIDPFMGSGTTGVACAKMGRSFIGIEIDEGYFDIACRRIEDAYRQADMFVEAQDS